MKRKMFSGRRLIIQFSVWVTHNTNTTTRLLLMLMLCLRKMEERGFISLDLAMITAVWKTTSASGGNNSGRH